MVESMSVCGGEREIVKERKRERENECIGERESQSVCGRERENERERPEIRIRRRETREKRERD